MVIANETKREKYLEDSLILACLTHTHNYKTWHRNNKYNNFMPHNAKSRTVLIIMSGNKYNGG